MCSGRRSHAQGWRDACRVWRECVFDGVAAVVAGGRGALIANLALGILNRAAPQIGIFQVGFPVTMLVGMLLLQLMVPNLIPFFQRVFESGIGEMGRVAAGMW